MDMLDEFLRLLKKAICCFSSSICSFPFVIRPHLEGYRLIGDAYIHGIMDEQPGHVLEEPYYTTSLI
jgi:hypothetical protein